VEPFLVIVAMITSLGSYLVGIRWRGRSPARLRAALGRLLECLGAVAVFAAINLTLAAALILGVRTFTGWFVSLYLLDDVAWLIVSLLQGIAWSLWRPDRGQ
jgi:hypothetical protein